MNKTELVNAVSEAANITKKDAASAVNAVLDTIAAELACGEKVQLPGFGTFEVRERAARNGKNLQTGETILIPAAKVPAFKAGKGLKETVNK